MQGWGQRDRVGENPGPLLSLCGGPRWLSDGAQAALLLSLSCPRQGTPERSVPMHTHSRHRPARLDCGSLSRLLRSISFEARTVDSWNRNRQRAAWRGLWKEEAFLQGAPARRSTLVHPLLPPQQILGCLGPSWVRPNLLPLKGLVLGTENSPRGEQAEEG